MRAESGFLKGCNPTMAIWSKGIVFAVVIFAFIWTEQAGGLFTAINGWILATLKWWYLGLVAFMLFFVVWLLFSRWGNIRLGDDDERPEFSYFSWFAMLFGAGMGIGLVFWSIAEPIYHFESNPFMAKDMAQSPEAAQIAMRVTFFHWGLHPWAIYVVVALSLAYFAYRKKLPLTIRSSLYPIIGERIYGPIGHAADILAVFGTVFGVATSLGLGVQQMATGLFELTGIGFFVDVGADGKQAPKALPAGRPLRRSAVASGRGPTQVMFAQKSGARSVSVSAPSNPDVPQRPDATGITVGFPGMARCGQKRMQ